MAKPNDKQPSQLTQDAVAATQTGLSYGYYIAQRRAKQQAAKTPQKRILTCIQCGLKFICYTKREQKFCSTSCKKKYLNAHKHDAAKMAALNNLPTKICPICQTEFPLVDTRMKYCSKECAAVANRARSAKNNLQRKLNAKGRML